MRYAVVLSVLLVALPARADYKVTLVGTNRAVSPSGESIQLTGNGMFDPDTQVARINGSFTILAPDGKAIRRGTWRTHAFSRFTHWGGPDPREHGGVLEVMATFVSDNGVLEQQRMRFTCLVNRPESSGADEGVTVGRFVEAAGGTVRFAAR
jgi:hypothetical protein